MSKKSQFSPKLKDNVILIGYDPEGRCVYNDFSSIHKYYDDLHPWDSSKKIKALRLHRVHGFIFDEKGKLSQEFESHFNIETGDFESGWTRDEDGIITN